MSGRDPHAILLKPILTEKSTALREDLNKICFSVHPRANKIEVRRAVEIALKVKVAKVNLMNMMGKTKRLGRWTGKRSNWKKAVITLRKGEKVDLFERT